MDASLEDRIRTRAYFLSQGGGGVDHGTHFWLAAERELLAEVASSAAATQLWEGMPAAEPTKPASVSVAERK
jgi:hypothetical protein